MSARDLVRERLRIELLPIDSRTCASVSCCFFSCARYFAWLPPKYCFLICFEALVDSACR